MTIWVFTFRSRSAKGMMNVSPGSRGVGSARPKRKMMPRSYWLITRTPAASHRATSTTTTTRSSIMGGSLFPFSFRA